MQLAVLDVVCFVVDDPAAIPLFLVAGSDFCLPADKIRSLGSGLGIGKKGNGRDLKRLHIITSLELIAK